MQYPIRSVQFRTAAALVLALAAGGPPARAQAQQKGPSPRIQNAAARKPVSGDPVVNLSSSNAPGVLPAGALRAPGIEEEGESESWEAAEWRHATLKLSGSKLTSLAIAAPSVLMVRATWKQNVDVNISVLQGSTVLASAKSLKGFDGLRSAAVHVKVPAAATVTVKATSTSAGAVVELYTGVLAAAQ